MKKFRINKKTKEFICEECNNNTSFTTIGGLGLHIVKTHKISTKFYYDKWIFEKGDNICKVNNCNNETLFTDILTVGYKPTCCRKCGAKLGGQTFKAKCDDLKNQGKDTPFNSPKTKEKRKETLKRIKEDDPDYYKKRQEKIRATNIIRHSDPTYNNPEKCKETKLKNHGDENYVNVEKCKETKLKNHGNENYNNIEKIKETFQKHSEEDPEFFDKALEKRIETNKQIRNVDFPTQDPEVIKKSLETLNKHVEEDPEFWNKRQEKIRETKILLYNDPNYVNIEKQKETNKRKLEEDPEWKNKQIEKQLETKKNKLKENPEYENNRQEKIKSTNLIKYGDERSQRSKEVKERMRNTREAKGLWISLENKSDWELYKRLVNRATEENLLLHGIKYINENRQSLRKQNKLLKTYSDKLTVDHKFSVHEGFKNNIDPKIIGNIVNLRILTRSQNSKKHVDCLFTLDDLLSAYNQFLIDENLLNS